MPSSECGIPAAAVHSTWSLRKSGDVSLDEIRNERLKLLYVAPERLLRTR